MAPNHQRLGSKLIASVFSSAVKTSLSNKPETSSTKFIVKKHPIVKDNQDDMGKPLPVIMVLGSRSRRRARRARLHPWCHNQTQDRSVEDEKPAGWKNTKAYRKNRKRNARRRAAAEAARLVALKDTPSASPTEALVPSTKDNGSCPLLSLPYAVLTEGVLSFLRPEDMAPLVCTNKYAKKVTQDGYLWQFLFKKRFPQSALTSKAMKEWKRAYHLQLTKIVDRSHCFKTQKTFLEDVLGVGVLYTVNPKTKNVDYIDISHDLLSATAFEKHKVRQDVFGNKFKLSLPLYFSEEYFQRALPLIQKAIFLLCSPGARNYSRSFEPLMVLEVMPKIINTFTVLLSDQELRRPFAYPPLVLGPGPPVPRNQERSSAAPPEVCRTGAKSGQVCLSQFFGRAPASFVGCGCQRFCLAQHWSSFLG